MHNSLESHLDTVWEVIHQWEEDCLGNRTGRGHTEGDDDAEFVGVYDNVCHAMARIKEIAEGAQGKYNGWSNYATWKVNLEFFDGMSLSGNDGWFDPERVEEIVREVREDQEAFCRSHFKSALDVDTWIYGIAKRELADYLKEGVKTAVSDRLNPNFVDGLKDDPFVSIIDGWVNAWLDDVSFLEILEHMLEGDDHFADLFVMEVTK